MECYRGFCLNRLHDLRDERSNVSSVIPTPGPTTDSRIRVRPKDEEVSETSYHGVLHSLSFPG